MRICLLSMFYPPHNTEGISRQRHILATELARQGHDVHVATSAAFSRSSIEHGVHVHRLAVDALPVYSERFPRLNPMLARSQALYDGVLQAAHGMDFDIVDYPLWSAQGFITQQFGNMPTVVWLQTTLAQLLKLYERPPSPEENMIMALEKMCLEQAHGILADSGSILDEVKLDYGLQGSTLNAVAYLGLPRVTHMPKTKSDHKQVQALVVGRLEKRKGTQFLFKILPNLLRRHPELRIDFVGRDNSLADGWQAAHGLTYSQFFRQQFAGLADRVHFHDYVSEKQLQEFYRAADLQLVPSLYESFGLIYLEAMRVGLPLVTFDVGAAAEIFLRGEEDGALIAPLQDADAFEFAVERLVEDHALRVKIGQRGLLRFEQAFTAEEMTRATLRFYAEVTRLTTRTARPAEKIYQVMEGLQAGDAVSTIAIRNADLLETLGQPRTILTRFAQEAVRHFTSPRNEIFTDPASGLIFHYWGYNHSTWMLALAQGRKALYYHNITPPHFFSKNSLYFQNTSKGYEQLAQIVNRFDLLIGDSQFNLDGLAEFLHEPKPALVIHPIVDVEQILAAPVDASKLAQLNVRGQKNILFVGRVARNKRQDLLMRVFDYYQQEIDPQAHLWLVGNDNGDLLYRAELEDLRLSLQSGAQIHLTGKASDAEVNAYYRSAHVFLSASEHEGFGMPLIEAMAHDIPVIAYASSAVPETMGQAGILIYDWNIERVAELMQFVTQDAPLRARLLAGQRINLNRFSTAQASKHMRAAIECLTREKENTLLRKIEPQFVK